MRNILYLTFAFLFGAVLIGCSGSNIKTTKDISFTVKHIPNPCDKHIYNDFYKKLIKAPFIWFYRTEVTNVSDRSIKILWLWTLVKKNGEWIPTVPYPSDNKYFVARYSGNPDAFDDQGYIMPGKTAVLDPNWYKSNVPSGITLKVSFVGMDRKRNEYLVESYIKCEPIEVKKEENKREK